MLLICFALFFASMAFQQWPFNSFEDDASWLLPSLAWDMSSLTWAEQLARDVGERGAMSLNMMLRFLYLIFGFWPTGYILFGILAHTVCSFLLFVALKKCGFAQITSLTTTVLFYFCSMHFHAIFWIIGVQHVLAMSSVLVTCILAQYVFRSAFNLDKKISIFQYALLAILLFSLGINRASIVFNLLALSFFYIYYALRINVNVNVNKRYVRVRRIYGFYVMGMLLIPVYGLYQFSRQAEGYQVINAIHGTGMPIYVIQYFSSLPHLYIGLIFSLVVICGVTNYGSRCISRYITKYFSDVCYYGAILLLSAVLLFLKKTQSVLPAIIENLVFIPHVETLDMRWSPIYSFRFELAEANTLINITLALAIPVCFLFARPKRNSGKLLTATLICMMATSLIYFNSLTNPPLSIDAIPSRYLYYFTPLLILFVVNFFTNILNLKRFPNLGVALNEVRYSGGRLTTALKTGSLTSSSKRDFLSSFVLFALVSAFIVCNVRMLYKRLDHATVHTYYVWFELYPSFILAESIASWARQQGRSGEILISLYGYQGVNWDENPYIGSFIPPKDSVFDPALFRTQAYLTQMISRETRFRVVSESADIVHCPNGWYGAEASPRPFRKASSQISAVNYPTEVQCNCGAGLIPLMPKFNQESSLLRGALKVFPDPLKPRYEASLYEGMNFRREGFPNFLVAISGLSGREGFGRWTDGPVLKLRFKDTLPGTFTLKLSFGATGFNVGKDVLVRVGEVHRRLTVLSPVATEYSLHFQGVTVADTIEIIPFSHARPVDIDAKNPDTRALGLAMIYLKIEQ
jgi:hypothetical protein